MISEPPPPDRILVPRLGFWALMLSLFLHPAEALLTVRLQRRWKAALFSLLLLILGASTLQCWRLHRDMAPHMEALRGYLCSIAPLELRDGKLHWREGIPLQFSAPEFSIRFLKEGDNASDLISPIQFLVYPDQIRMRAYFGDAQTPVDRVVMDGKKLQKWFARKGDDRITAEDFLPLVYGARTAFLLVFFLMFVLSFSWEIFFFLSIFFLVTLVFRRDARSHKVELLVLALNSAVVPTVTAMVWFTLLRGRFDFSNLFCWAFMIYLIYLYFHRHVTLYPVAMPSGEVPEEEAGGESSGEDSQKKE